MWGIVSTRRRLVLHVGRHAAQRVSGTRQCSSRAVLVADDLTSDGTPSGVKLLTLNRPEKLNPMTVGMGDALRAAVEELRPLPPNELKAVVVTGAGRAFSAGGDLAFLDERRQGSPTANAETMRAFYDRFLCVRSLPVPVIACINGPAIGAGLCFALAADVRITSDSAKLGLTFVGLGLHPGMGCSHTLTRIAGTQVTNALLLSGDVLSGAEARAHGLVFKSMPDADSALTESVSMARRIAQQSPLAVRSTLKTLRGLSDEGLERALQREADAQSQSYASGDFAEGLAGLKEKRRPVFRGQ